MNSLPQSLNLQTELRPHAGSSWGSWGSSEFCPNNSWASGYQLMVEPSCGDICDDTALNSVKLFCSSLTGTDEGFVTSKTGNFGGWNDPLLCGEAGSFIDGIQFKSERVSSGNISVCRLILATQQGDQEEGDGGD